MDLFVRRRISYTEIGKIYFWTASINKWNNLLEKDEFKTLVIESIAFLSQKNLIHVFAFVIY